MKHGKKWAVSFMIVSLSVQFTTVLPAESSEALVRIPDSLIFEVVTTPGYEWIEVICLQQGGGTDPTPPPGSSDGTDHTAHHPDPARPVAPESEWISTTLQELAESMKALEHRAGPAAPPRAGGPPASR